MASSPGGLYDGWRQVFNERDETLSCASFFDDSRDPIEARVQASTVVFEDGSSRAISWSSAP